MGSSVGLLMSYLATDKTSRERFPAAVRSIDCPRAALLYRSVGEGPEPPRVTHPVWFGSSHVDVVEPQPQTWNKLWRDASTFDYIAIFNADDEWLPGGIDALADALDAHPDAVVAYGDHEQVLEDGTSLGCHMVLPPDAPISESPVPGPFAMFRASAAKQVEIEPGMLWPEDHLRCADWHLWVRLSTVGPFVMVDKPVGRFLLRDSSLSHNDPEAFRAEQRRVKAWAREYLAARSVCA